MSKLFETLETIRRRESTRSRPMAATREKPTTGRPVKMVVLALLAFMLLGGGLYYTTFRSNDRPGSKAPPGSESESKQPVEQLTTAVSAPPDQPAKLVETNNIAVALIRNHDHWRAIYLLTSLVEQHPDRIEPLINLGVALAEVGLWEPAHEYLSRARTLDPKHPLLRENIAILRRAGLFEGFYAPSSSQREGLYD